MTFPTAEDIEVLPNITGFMPFLRIYCYNKKETESLKQQIIQDHEIVERLKSSEMLEKLSSVEHFQWCRWALQLMDRETLSKDRVERWTKLLVDYDKLSEEQKEEDRRYARLVLKSILENKK